MGYNKNQKPKRTEKNKKKRGQKKLFNIFLAKIFKEKENEEGEELNLNSVLVLNPKNEEAIYMLTLLKIKQYNYNEAKELIEKFNLVCSSFCQKKNEINEKFSKLKPEDEKNNN